MEERVHVIIIVSVMGTFKQSNNTKIEEKFLTVELKAISCFTNIHVVWLGPSWLFPCVKMHQHMQQPCFSKLHPPSFWNGASIMHFFILCLMFWGTVFDDCWTSKSRAGKKDWEGRRTLADHTLRNPAILRGLECHSCNWLFHQQWQLLCHTRCFDALLQLGL